MVLGLGASGSARAEIPAGGTAPHNAASLVPGWMRSLRIAVEITAEEVIWQQTSVRDLRAHLDMVDAHLRIRAASPQAAGGRLQLDVEHGPDGGSHVRVQGTALELGAIGPVEAYVDATPVTLDMTLDGSGTSLRALAQSAHGSIGFHSTGPGAIGKTVERVSGSLLSSVFRAFAPLRSAGETTEIECLRVHLPIEQGRAEGPLLAELWTRRMRIQGGGRIDFGNETVDLIFRPRARGGVQIRGLNAVYAVTVNGSFHQPRVDIDSGRLLSRAAALGTAVATVGGTAVIDTFNAQRESRRQPCAELATAAAQR